MSSTMSAAKPGESTAEPGKYPRWYAVLFASDTLERFGFYGLQAILVLYAAAPHSRGGLQLASADAASLFGAWIAVMFMLSLPGGWVGDRMLGNRRALQLGALVTFVGYLFMAVPGGSRTAVGLCLLAVGGGLYKPNHQAMINLMYGANTIRREAGISLMFVGVQASALIAPLVSGYLGERVNWNLGFAVAAIAMLICVIMWSAAAAPFGDVGHRPGRPLEPAERRKVGSVAGALVVALAAAVVGAGLTGALSATLAITVAGLLSVIVPIIGYNTLYRNKGLAAGDRRRLRGFLAVFLGATLFWMIIAHAASLLNLFASNHVNRDLFGWTLPASWLQAATPAFMLVLAPVFAWVLPRIGRDNNVAVKFSLGLFLVGGSFLLMSLAATGTSGGAKVSPLWLVVVYLAHACGELIVSAVTIAAAGDVLPRQFMARVLGLLWLFAALGGGLGAGLVRLAGVIPEPVYYLGLGSVAVLCGVAFAVRRRALTRALSWDYELGSAPSTVDAVSASAAT